MKRWTWLISVLCLATACDDAVLPLDVQDGGHDAAIDAASDANSHLDAANDATIGNDAAQGHDAGNDAAQGHDAGNDASIHVDAGDPPQCKRGVAYGHHSVDDMRALSDGVWWWYNWATRPDSDLRASYSSLGVEFTPMVWGGNFNDTQINDELLDDARYLLGFNEPNFFVQANLSPTQAANLWPRIEAIADANNLEIVSPAVNFCGPAESCHDTSPFDYLDDFFAACDGCRVDYIAAHWYACDGPALTWYLGELKKYNKPIWLTEFSCGDGADRSLAKQKQYMEDALSILEADDDVFRYAWFAARTEAIPNVDLLAESGALTELGELYVSLPHHDPRCAR